MKNVLSILILFHTFTSCISTGSDIRNYSATTIRFEKMPVEVQRSIKDFYSPVKKLSNNGDTLTIYDSKKELICLDSDIVKCEYKLVWSKLVSSWLDHRELIINKNKIIIEQSNHGYNEPFIVYNKLLYCRINMNTNDYENPAKDEFQVIEINKGKNQQ